MKQHNKNIRQEITSEVSHKNPKASKGQFGKQLKLDASIYQRAHPGKQLMWISDFSNDVQWWLDRGASPVPAVSAERTIYKGLNDKSTSEWVSETGGKDDNGNEYRLFLLMIDPELYDELKLEPERQRQQEIMDAMKIGNNQSDIGDHLPGGGGIQTYAPNLPDSTGRGYNEVRPNRG